MARGSRPAPPPRTRSPVTGRAALLAEAVRRHRAGDLDRAEAGYRRVLAENPRNADALHLLGLVAHQRGDHARARDLIGQALALAGDNAAFLNSLGGVLLALAQPAEAENAFRRAIARDPSLAELHNNLGNALVRQGRAAEALVCYDRAIGLRPGYAEALSNLGSACQRLGHLDEAERALQKALERSPRYPSALANLGLVRHDQGRYMDALATYEQALALDPKHPTARANRAVLLLLLGRYEEGWREYEWRWRVDGFTTPRRSFDAPPWSGQPLDGGTLLVHAEQGLGSAIQFVRYVPLVAGRCRRVIVECQPPLARLFRLSLEGAGGGRIEVVVRGDSVPACDAQAALMSLPWLCGTTRTTVPAAVPYLEAPTDEAERWRQELAAAPRPRVGLVWSGNPRHLNDRNRSMPAAALAPLVAAAGSFYALQVGPAEAALADLPAGRVRNLAPALTDFAATAAVVEALDLIVSVDTAVAHLAGALARPVWLLLPHVPEWRWLLDRADTPWYPTMRLFRQPAPGDWSAVVGRVGAELATLVG